MTQKVSEILGLPFEVIESLNKDIDDLQKRLSVTSRRAGELNVALYDSEKIVRDLCNLSFWQRFKCLLGVNPLTLLKD